MDDEIFFGWIILSCDIDIDNLFIFFINFLTISFLSADASSIHWVLFIGIANVILISRLWIYNFSWWVEFRKIWF